MAATTEVALPSGGHTLSLRDKLRAADRRRKLKAFALVAPLLIFIVFAFVVPILSTLYFSIDDPKLPQILPRTAVEVARWDGLELPGESAYAALVADLQDAYETKTAAIIGMRLNYEISGFRSMLMRTARRSKRLKEPPYKDALIAVEVRWGNIDYWRGIKAAGGPFTTRYLLAAVDLKRQWDGSVVRAPPERTLYVSYLKRTLWISLWVLVYCIAIGYPMAYLIATSEKRRARMLLMLVLLPFWTSLLVRTAAWVVLLQAEGVVNSALISFGLTTEPLELIFNRLGVYIAMVHILLPFLVLPLYAVMRNIPHTQMRAAASLGARPMAAFLSVYLPQTLPGLGAGCLLVFILSLGFYITPALIGGPSDQMLSYLIAAFATRTGNWGMSSAIAVLLLLTVAALYPIYRGLLGRGAIRLA